jgi:hypothetical protein
MKNIVFYSKYKKDVNSPKLLAFINATPFAKEFCFVCIDPDPVTKKRNDDLLFLLEVSEVPTLFVNGEKYVGEDAFEWVEHQYLALRNMGRNQAPPQTIEPRTSQRAPQVSTQSQGELELGCPGDSEYFSIEEFTPSTERGTAPPQMIPEYTKATKSLGDNDTIEKLKEQYSMSLTKLTK